MKSESTTSFSHHENAEDLFMKRGLWWSRL